MEYKIDTNLYSKDILDEAISDYSEYFQISISDNLLQIDWEDKWETDETFNEFMNYVIWLINQ